MRVDVFINKEMNEILHEKAKSLGIPFSRLLVDGAILADGWRIKQLEERKRIISASGIVREMENKN